ncbi:MAG TPA: YdeI/OmpD-associated family protein [Vicinamibacterales bacterium]|nr:YdeI/OmpD-associated family protein [Vicinamibacterales bacterium]
MPKPADVRFFKTAAELRKWFRANHRSADELWVGFYRKGSGRTSITWPEAVDEALCVGWIDGVRHRVDEDSYTNRFTPRRKGSVWSAINIARVEVLTREKRMQAAGLAAFAERKANKSGIYAYEQRRDTLEEPYAGMMQKHPRAWAFFQAQPPYYRKLVGWYVISAKRDDTRLARFQRLLDACLRGERLR